MAEGECCTPPNPPPSDPPPPEEVALVSFEDFKKIHLRTAEILEAANHPKADRLTVMKIKVGEKTKQIVAGIRQFYAPEQLVGKTIIVVDNLEPARLRGEESNGMLLAVTLPDGGLRLLQPDGPAESGLVVS